jgi:hypothetical protein
MMKATPTTLNARTLSTVTTLCFAALAANAGATPELPKTPFEWLRISKMDPGEFADSPLHPQNRESLEEEREIDGNGSLTIGTSYSVGLGERSWADLDPEPLGAVVAAFEEADLATFPARVGTPRATALYIPPIPVFNWSLNGPKQTRWRIEYRLRGETTSKLIEWYGPLAPDPKAPDSTRSVLARRLQPLVDRVRGLSPRLATLYSGTVVPEVLSDEDRDWAHLSGLGGKPWLVKEDPFRRLLLEAMGKKVFAIGKRSDVFVKRASVHLHPLEITKERLVPIIEVTRLLATATSPATVLGNPKDARTTIGTLSAGQRVTIVGASGGMVEIEWTGHEGYEKGFVPEAALRFAFDQDDAIPPRAGSDESRRAATETRGLAGSLGDR